jgi:hypothetical protein
MDGWMDGWKYASDWLTAWSFALILLYIQVVATGRRGERLKALQQELGGPDRVHTVQADVADLGAMKEALTALPPAFQAVDVLVRVVDRILALLFSFWFCLLKNRTMIFHR